MTMSAHTDWMPMLPEKEKPGPRSCQAGTWSILDTEPLTKYEEHVPQQVCTCNKLLDVQTPLVSEYAPCIYRCGFIARLGCKHLLWSFDGLALKTPSGPFLKSPQSSLQNFWNISWISPTASILHDLSQAS